MYEFSILVFTLKVFSLVSRILARSRAERPHQSVGSSSSSLTTALDPVYTMASTSRYFTSSKVYSAASPGGAPATVEVDSTTGRVKRIHSGRQLDRSEVAGTVADEDWIDVGDDWILPGVSPWPVAGESLGEVD
jgi:hypothetical protein